MRPCWSSWKKNSVCNGNTRPSRAVTRRQGPGVQTDPVPVGQCHRWLRFGARRVGAAQSGLEGHSGSYCSAGDGEDEWARGESGSGDGNGVQCSGDDARRWPTPGRMVPSLSKNSVRIGPGDTASIFRPLRRSSICGNRARVRSTRLATLSWISSTSASGSCDAKSPWVPMPALLMRVSTVYRYFPSKDDTLRAAIAGSMLQFEALIAEVGSNEKASTAAAYLRLLLDTLRRFRRHTEGVDLFTLAIQGWA